MRRIARRRRVGMASNLSLGSSVVVNRPSTGSPDPRQRPFRSGHRPVSGRLCGTAGGGADHRVPVSRCLSAAGIRFSGHPVARWGIQPSSRSAYRAQRRPDPVGVATFRTRKMRPDWVPPRPRDGGAHPAASTPSAGACRFSTASPPHPATTSHLRGSTMTRHHRGFTHVHPPGLPLTRGPRMEREPFGLNPGLRTPQLPTTHAEAGTGHRALAWDYTIDTSRPPFGVST